MPSPTTLIWIAGALITAAIVAVSVRNAGLWRRPPGPMRGAAPRFSRLSPVSHPVLGATLAAVAVIAVVAVVQASSTVQAVDELSHSAQVATDARHALGTDPGTWASQVNIDTARALQREAAKENAEGLAHFNASLLVRAAAVLPGASDQVAATRDLAKAGAAGIRGVGGVIQLAGDFNRARLSGAPAESRVLQLLQSADQNLSATGPDLQASMAALDRDSSRPLLPALSKAVKRARADLAPAVTDTTLLAAAGKYGPLALGAQKPVNYLVLLPNSSELRPGGGFSGAIATVTMVGAAPQTVEVRGQDEFNPTMKKRLPVPTPLARYLKFYKNGLELGDAGWDPDFPTSARTTEELYNNATGKSVDATVSVDPYAIAALLGVTGPVDVPGYGTFDQASFFQRLNVIVNASTGPGTGKAALSPVSKAVLAKVLATPLRSWPQLLRVVKEQADQRHIQAYFHDPTLAQATAGAHWDGALVQPAGDYLMVADANVGATKGDGVVQKSVTVKTELHPERGMALHQVELTYAMPAPVDNVDRLLNPGDGSYRDYLRVIVPQEAVVASVKASSPAGKAEGGLDTIAVSHDKLAIGAFLRVPRGQSATLTLVYEVPITPGTQYAMYLQKEPGNALAAVEMQVSYPGGLKQSQVALATDREVTYSW